MSEILASTKTHDLTSDIEVQTFNTMQLSTELLPSNELIKAIDSLDNRLSDVQFNQSDTSVKNIASAIKTIVQRFGGTVCS